MTLPEGARLEGILLWQTEQQINPPCHRMCAAPFNIVEPPPPNVNDTAFHQAKVPL